MDWWVVGLVANAVVAVAYFGICAAIVVPLVRSHQLRSNPLGGATAAIFFTCAVHHGTHSVHMLMPVFGLDLVQGTAMRDAWGWQLALWDVVGALVGVYYWTLRRNYGSLDGGRPALRGHAQARGAGARAERQRAAGPRRGQDVARPRRPAAGLGGAGDRDRLGQPHDHRPAGLRPRGFLGPPAAGQPRGDRPHPRTPTSRPTGPAAPTAGRDAPRGHRGRASGDRRRHPGPPPAAAPDPGAGRRHLDRRRGRGRPAGHRGRATPPAAAGDARPRDAGDGRARGAAADQGRLPRGEGRGAVRLRGRRDAGAVDAGRGRRLRAEGHPAQGDPGAGPRAPGARAGHGCRADRPPPGDGTGRPWGSGGCRGPRPAESRPPAPPTRPRSGSWSSAGAADAPDGNGPVAYANRAARLLRD